MTTTITRPTRASITGFFERHAWKALVATSIIIGVFGVSDMVRGGADLQGGETVLMHSQTGQSWVELQAASPDAAHMIDNRIRTGGGALAVIGLLSLAICLTAFRRHELWAWLALWSLPGWMVLTVAFVASGVRYPQFGTPVPVISGSVLAAVCAVCLLGCSRPFFKRRVSALRL